MQPWEHQLEVEETLKSWVIEKRKARSSLLSLPMWRSGRGCVTDWVTLPLRGTHWLLLTCQKRGQELWVIKKHKFMKIALPVEKQGLKEEEESQAQCCLLKSKWEEGGSQLL